MPQNEHMGRRARLWTAKRSQVTKSRQGRGIRAQVYASMSASWDSSIQPIFENQRAVDPAPGLGYTYTKGLEWYNGAIC